MKEDASNDCGITPFKFRGWSKNACMWHDKAYLKDSWHQQNLTREQVDRWFHTLLLIEANKGKFKALKRIQAYFMYQFVRAFGSKWWEA
jgi:hypothetical protein